MQVIETPNFAFAHPFLCFLDGRRPCEEVVFEPRGAGIATQNGSRQNTTPTVDFVLQYHSSQL
jgi:hypothetical protein